MLNSNGLTNKEVNISRNKYGSNSINGKNKSTFISLFIETLGDPIIKILLIALAVKTLFLFHDFDWFETIGIVIAIFVATFKAKAVLPIAGRAAIIINSFSCSPLVNLSIS